MDLLQMQMKALLLPIPEKEYRFHATRRWRADYGWPEYRLACEVEGGAWCGGRHNRGKGFLTDMEKYDMLTLMGWALLRFTPEMVAKGKAAETVKIWFDTWGEERRNALQRLGTEKTISQEIFTEAPLRSRKRS